MRETDSHISAHISILETLSDAILEKVDKAFAVFKHLEESGTFQVVKVSKTQDQVHLLSYPKFWDALFPELKECWTMEFMDGGVRVQHYTYSEADPPILTHKDQYITPDHRDASTLREVTAKCEAAGCFDIPIETRSQLIRVLNEKGVEL